MNNFVNMYKTTEAAKNMKLKCKNKTIANIGK